MSSASACAGWIFRRPIYGYERDWPFSLEAAPGLGFSDFYLVFFDKDGKERKAGRSPLGIRGRTVKLSGPGWIA